LTSESIWKTASMHAVPGWPPLAWVAVVDLRSLRYSVYHGEHVETGPGWAFEGVWSGRFVDADFDTASEVYGSGLRVRPDRIVIATPSTTTERVWYTAEHRVVVGNSLPAVLAVTRHELLPSVDNYPALSAQSPASPAIDATIPADPGPIHLLKFHNLEVTRHGVHRIEKPDTPRFGRYEEYESYLLATADALGSNAADPQRRYAVRLLTTISSGYDSPAAAVIARRMGCTQAVTIADARSAIPRSDSGEEVARQLGLDCTVYPRGGRASTEELFFWAGLGHPQDEHFSIFDYPEPVCMLFTGQFGGSVWSIDSHFHTPFDRPDWSGLGFAEYRLQASVVHCPVPFIGAQHARDVLEIGTSEAMEPWRLHGDYDRPVPRRLLEEAGVRRESFGMRKSATQYDDSFLWPRRKDLAADYREYLHSHGLPAPPVALARLVSTVYGNVVFPIEARLLGRSLPRRLWLGSQSLLFQWANERLNRRFARALSESEA
jgi:hypothetical protein